MISFENDYAEGAHELVLKRLFETNMAQEPGYGFDSFTESAKAKIREACGAPDADVYFLAGGTQTNATVIDAFLRNYEGVICAGTGHIAVHEAGAIEAGGHKVLTLPEDTKDGKVNAEALRTYLAQFYADSTWPHMSIPGMVYISQPTELGTLYTKAELTALRAVCDEYKLKLYADGARLAYALACKENDVSLKDLAALCDAFYIGGTKCGTLCGEAVIFAGKTRPAQFFTTIKQHGALFAKGRLCGVQFDALFTDELYEKCGAHAIRLSEKLRKAFAEKGYPFYADSPTNQIFVILTKEQLERIGAEIRFSVWAPCEDGRTAVRFVTCWATTEEAVDRLIALL